MHTCHRALHTGAGWREGYVMIWLAPKVGVTRQAERGHSVNRNSVQGVTPPLQASTLR